ncbi:MAG: hypothetical protein ACI8RZ_001885, partial [Myxococcota bacterium]
MNSKSAENDQPEPPGSHQLVIFVTVERRTRRIDRWVI